MAAAIVAQATDPEDTGGDPYEGKNPAAFELGRLGGQKGGKARAEKLTAEERSAIARKASQARWGVGLEMAVEDTEVQRPPVPATLPLVIGGSTASAPPAAALRRTSGTDVDHHGLGLLVEVDSLDHCLPVDTEQFAPYVGTEQRHPPCFDFEPSNSPKT